MAADREQNASKPGTHEVEKAEPAIVKERRLAEESKKTKAAAKEKARCAEIEESNKAGYLYFKQSDLALLRQSVVIHPTVLLAISDHYTRSAEGTSRRVVGVLLGERQGSAWHITNTFGIPFEEDSKDPAVWYLDHSYLEKMCLMFKKINAREHVAGWYSTGTGIKEADIDIHELIRKYCQHPLFLLVDVLSQDTKKLPVQTYYSFEQPADDEHFRRSFVHMACSIGATEAEEVGVEHLLRDFQGTTTSTLTSMIQDKVTALQHLSEKLADIADYLEAVADGEMEPRPHILTQLQRLLNALPDKTDGTEVAEAFQLATNDSLLASYVAFATRLVFQVHKLVQQKLSKQLQGAPKGEATTEPSTTEPAAAAEEAAHTMTDKGPHDPDADPK